MTLVVDASLIAEFLIDSPCGHLAMSRIRADPDLHVPHHAVVEVTSVLRGWVRGGHLPEQRAHGALADLAALPAVRWPAEPLLPRTWQLRETMTPYDAVYVALAEALDASLLTADARLHRAARQVSARALELVEATTGR